MGLVFGRLDHVTPRTLATASIIEARELAVFEESQRCIEFEALRDSRFILGSAVKHPYALVLGIYSVHTNQRALIEGETRIAEIGERLRAEGRLSAARRS